MYKRDYRDLIGGSLLVVVGMLIVLHASQTLNFGTIRRMGPGMFPVSLGAILAVFGTAIAVPAWFREGTVERIELRAFVAVLGGIAAFALMINPFGLIPAITGLVLIVGLAETRYRPVPLVVICVSLSLFSYLVFRILLGLPLVMYRLPL
jgi:hypothetical protein